MGMNFFLLVLVSTLVSITLSHRPNTLVTANEDLIHNTCKSTKYYQLCLASLKSNPGSQEADTKGLAMIMAGIGFVNATETSSFLSSQVANTKNDTGLMKVLKECSDKYSYAGDAMEASVQDLAGDAFDYAYTRIAAAADYPNACKNGFKRYSGLAYPHELARREDGLKRICAVALGIIDLLEGNGCHMCLVRSEDVLQEYWTLREDIKRRRRTTTVLVKQARSRSCLVDKAHIVLDLY